MEKKLSRYDDLMREAHKLILQKGYKATSVNDIVGKVNINKSSFYHHFTSKNDLLEKLIMVEHFTVRSFNKHGCEFLNYLFNQEFMVRLFYEMTVDDDLHIYKIIREYFTLVYNKIMILVMNEERAKTLFMLIYGYYIARILNIVPNDINAFDYDYIQVNYADGTRTDIEFDKKEEGICQK